MYVVVVVVVVVMKTLNVFFAYTFLKIELKIIGIFIGFRLK